MPKEQLITLHEKNSVVYKRLFDGGGVKDIQKERKLQLIDRMVIDAMYARDILPWIFCEDILCNTITLGKNGGVVRVGECYRIKKLKKRYSDYDRKRKNLSKVEL